MASDLISREALVDKSEILYQHTASGKIIPWSAVRVCAINNVPTVDAEPVRHGEWGKMVFTDSGKFAGYKCSECGLIAKRKFSYCHCGAKMDGGAK